MNVPKTNPDFISKKIVAALVLAVAVVSISLYSTRERSESKRIPQKTAENKTGDINLAELTARDSDKDGVLDWEEYLWGTNPENPDTYGKGLGDLAEIKNKKSLLGGGVAPRPESPPTETDMFAFDLFSSATALKQSGNYNPETVVNLLSGISDNLAEQGREKVYYSLSDLKIAEITADSIESYREAMMLTADKYSGYNLGNELLIIAEAVDKNKSEKLKEIENSVSVYRRLLGESLLVVVPENLSANHLAIVNAYGNIIESLGQAEKIFSDPIVGLVEMTRYRNATNSLIIAMGKIELYFAGVLQ